MTYEALTKSLGTGKIKPVYLLEGEEDFYIDQVADYFEKKLLSETEKEFNLTVFYGRDADWSEVLNACRRYPMFSEKQVVMLKEAQSMKTLDKLEPYLNNPLDSTIFVITYKHGKLDGRTSLKKLIGKKGEVLTTKRLYDNKVPEWIKTYAREQGYDVSPKGCAVLADHIGADLSRLSNEMNKLFLNLPKGKKIDEDDIERYVGISKDYNVFELQNAVGNKDIKKIMRILNYFAGNPKAAPVPVIFTILYNFFSKVYLLVNLPSRSDSELASTLKVPPYFLADYKKAAGKYSRVGTDRVLLILHEYNLRSLGVNDPGTPHPELLKEMIMKMLH